MTYISDIQVSKHSPEYKACVQRVIDTLHRNEGRLFAASEKELHDIRDNVPSGFNVWEIISRGTTRYIEIYGKKSVRDSKKA